MGKKKGKRIPLNRFCTIWTEAGLTGLGLEEGPPLHKQTNASINVNISWYFIWEREQDK